MKFLAVTTKDLKILLRDRKALMGLFLLPMMFITVMSLALAPLFRGPSDNAIRLPVVLPDQSEQDRQVLDALRALDGFTIETEVAVQGQPARAMTRADAEGLVRDGRRVAALIFPSGFSAALAQGQATDVILLQDPAQLNTASIVAAAIRGVLNSAQGHAVPQANLAAPEPLIKVDAQYVSAKRVESPGVYEQNVPGYSVLFMFFVVSYVAGSIVSEKRDGTFRRLMAAPVSKSALLAGKLLPNFMLGCAQIAIMFTMGHFVFGMQLGNDLLALAVVTVAVAAAATGLGILVAAVAKSEQQANGFASFVILTLGALGGSMVPLSVMPDFMQTIAKLTPHAWALTAYQNILVRGYGTLDVLPQVGVLLGFAAVFFGVALWRFRWEA
jgi:ABC-2 type transport system permease protein